MENHLTHLKNNHSPLGKPNQKSDHNCIFCFPLENQNSIETIIISCPNCKGKERKCQNTLCDGKYMLITVAEYPQGTLCGPCYQKYN